MLNAKRDLTRKSASTSMGLRVQHGSGSLRWQCQQIRARPSDDCLCALGWVWRLEAPMHRPWIKVRD